MIEKSFKTLMGNIQFLWDHDLKNNLICIRTLLNDPQLLSENHSHLWDVYHMHLKSYHSLTNDIMRVKPTLQLSDEQRESLDNLIDTMATEHLHLSIALMLYKASESPENDDTPCANTFHP